MHACGGTHTKICLGIGEYMMNSSMGYLKLTQTNCFKPWFQNRCFIFEL